MKKALACLLVCTLTSSLSWARPNQEPIKAINKKVANCLDHQQRRVVVETYDNRRLQGEISEARSEGFVLTYAGQATTLSYLNVRKIKLQSTVWKHVKALAAATAITGAIAGLVVLSGRLRG